MIRVTTISILVLVLIAPFAKSANKPISAAAERGKKALETRAFLTAPWSLSIYDTVWKQWGQDLKSKPDNYDQAFRERYGLHPAPFDNGKYPMGLRIGRGILAKGLATDCMMCHGGSIMGKSYVGLGNASLDIEGLFSEFSRASGRSGKLPFAYGHVRGTSEAGNFAVFLLTLREPNLQFRLKPMKLEIRDHLCEDAPAWWLLKKKQTMYHTGTTPAKSVRSIMQFMLASTNGPKEFNREEKTFRDIQAYLFSLEAPKYPFPIDQEKVVEGKKIFRKTCAKCHGSYGEKWTYPNRIVPHKIIGTDPTRLNGFADKWGHYYNKSWFAKEKTTPDGYEYKVQAAKGYQAPPLDAVWSTAPYLHNGSVPTLYHLLNSKSRPTVFTRSYRTDEAAYDKKNIGWKVQILRRGATDVMTPYEQRKIYDTNLPGRGNQGHTFGDGLTEDQRRAVIEYLKTL